MIVRQMIATFAALVAMTLATQAEPVTFAFAPGDEGTRVQFVSKAPMESFDGKTRDLAGSVTLDPTALGDSVTVRFEVDLTTLDTGIELRNRHMRENHLETEQYPKAVFTGAAILDSKSSVLPAGRAVTFECEGTFDLHGVQRRLRVPVTVTWNEAAGTLQVHTEFRVALADYEINRPKFLFLKLEDAQTVTVDAIGRLSGR